MRKGGETKTAQWGSLGPGWRQGGEFPGFSLCLKYPQLGTIEDDNLGTSMSIDKRCQKKSWLSTRKGMWTHKTENLQTIANQMQWENSRVLLVALDVSSVLSSLRNDHIWCTSLTGDNISPREPPSHSAFTTWGQCCPQRLYLQSKLASS